MASDTTAVAPVHAVDGWPSGRCCAAQGEIVRRWRPCPTAVNPASAYPRSATSMAFLLPSGTRKSAAPDPALRQPGQQPHRPQRPGPGPGGPAATAQRAAAQPRHREPGPARPLHDRRGRRPWGRLPDYASALATARTAVASTGGTVYRRRSPPCDRPASTRTRPPGPARPPSRTASAPISCGQISSGHSMRWSSSVSLSTGYTPGSPASIRHHRGAGQGPSPCPREPVASFPSQISARGIWGQRDMHDVTRYAAK